MNKAEGSTSKHVIGEIEYFLPEELIARYPLETRHNSRLLVYINKTIQDKTFLDLANYLPENSLLIFNDTRVVRARMHFRKSTGAIIEIFCLEPYEPADYERAFAKTGSGQWKCLVGNLRKWKHETLEKKIHANDATLSLRAKILEDFRDYQIIEFEWTNANLSFSELLEYFGETPIPPYLKREPEPMDQERYQTIYAHTDGSVAAPTAGLHFTSEVLKTLDKKSIKRLSLTLHVGAGTFRPVLTDSVNDHIMHSEYFNITREAIETLLHFNGNIIAVGTTSVRTLESLYYCGIKLLGSETYIEPAFHVSQWGWTELKGNFTSKDSLNALLGYMDRIHAGSFEASTQLMILPGYDFKMLDGMLTNFHQPKSTLLLLVSAFVGNDWKKIYDHAIKNRYRFLSYGDSSLLLKQRQQSKKFED
jgi:S-adenosylmethionine:tRNA ribosyltransferase-isomerase